MTSPSTPSAERPGPWGAEGHPQLAELLRIARAAAEAGAAVIGPSGDWLAGPVVAPALGTSWWASQRMGAYRQDGPYRQLPRVTAGSSAP